MKNETETAETTLTTLKIDKTIHRRAKLVALKNMMDLQEFVEEAVLLNLKRYE